MPPPARSSGERLIRKGPSTSALSRSATGVVYAASMAPRGENMYALFVLQRRIGGWRPGGRRRRRLLGLGLQNRRHQREQQQALRFRLGAQIAGRQQWRLQGEGRQHGCCPRATLGGYLSRRLCHGSML